MMTPLTMIHIDGATAGTRQVGAAAVARTTDGRFLGWLSRQLPRMTNNEAEYHGLLLGLELAQRLGMERVLIVSDSEIVVRQMEGRSRVLSARLRALHREACQTVRTFDNVRFRHVPREQNRLADALAGEALLGQTVQCDGPSQRIPQLGRIRSHFSRLWPPT
jgi:ribonuclease HI